MRFVAGLSAAVLALAAPLVHAQTERELPDGTQIPVSLDSTLTTKSTKVGDRFTATVQQPVIGRQGETLVPQGSKVLGSVTAVQPPKNGQQAAIKLDFRDLEIQGRDYPVSAEVSNVGVKSSKDTSAAKRDAAIGGVGGAVVGGVAGGLKGVIIGGALGAGAGTAIGLYTSGDEGKLSKGAPMTLRTTEPIALPPATPNIPQR